MIIKNLIHFLALGFGSGLSSKAPGTMGTLAAIPLYWLLAHFSPWLYFFTVLGMSFIGIYLCDVTAKDFAVGDDQRIVWDEIVGYLWTMFLAPVGWGWILGGFVLFRFFDILKPWPISVCDREVKGGLGIMLDDVMAAGYAWGILYGMRIWF